MLLTEDMNSRGRKDNTYVCLDIINIISGTLTFHFSSMAIDETRSYCRSNDHQFAYLYCDFKDSSYQTPVKVLGSLIGQLAKQQSEFPDCVQHLYDDHSNEGARPPSMEELFDLIRDVLKGKLCHTYLVLDALDECADRMELLKGLVKLNSNSDLKVNILVTSREERDIKQEFTGLPSHCLREADIAGDVELYVTAEMEREKRFKNIPPVVKLRIKSTLVEGAKGM